MNLMIEISDTVYIDEKISLGLVSSVIVLNTFSVERYPLFNFVPV